MWFIAITFHKYPGDAFNSFAKLFDGDATCYPPAVYIICRRTRLVKRTAVDYVSLCDSSMRILARNA